MPINVPLRILHISDLHFAGGKPHQQTVDMKVPGLSTTGPFMLDNLEAIFLEGMAELLQGFGPEDNWPKAIIVSGDLVNRGGTDREGYGEFQRATDFLRRLATTLKLGGTDHIYVVPGNHDVDWSPGLSQLQRFENYMKATEDFSSPSISNNELEPRICTLNIREGIPVELTLLISPTFSGITDPANDYLIDRIERILADDAQLVTEIRKQLTTTGRLLDIAAVGGHQRRKLRKPTRGEQGTIRIAVLHHHLLPDPQIEVSQFEAVLDAGKVLGELVDKNYDLVLSGHKHNRRLVHYETEGRTLDVYSAPRLLQGKDNSEPGFTIMDIHGPNSPAYAVLNYYNSSTFRLTNSVPLVREGRVLSSIRQICVSISQENQKEVVEPVLRSLRDALDWQTEAPDETKFRVVWDQLLKDLENIGKRRLTFRHPELWDQWSSLIKAVDPKTEIQVVSENDLEYWKKSKSALSEASKYASALRKFPGKKTRIWILDRSDLRARQQEEAASRVVEDMIDDGFRVVIVPRKSVPAHGMRDFGIIGHIAVSVFEGMEGECRSITESFNARDMRQARDTWKSLFASRVWDSDEGVTFNQWLADDD